MPIPRPTRMALAVWLIGIGTAAADPITYLSRAAWSVAVGPQVFDSFTDPGYAAGDVYDSPSDGFDIHSDAHMSGVLGETDYRATAHRNVNIVADGWYCAGCNGSFLLSFDSTSVTTGGGIYGLGFYFEVGTSSAPFEGFTAFTTLADGSTYNLPMPRGGGFVGFTSAGSPIESLHVGRRDGAIENEMSILLRNLAIAGAPDGTPTSPVPEPASLLLVGAGLAALAALRSRR